MKAVHFGAGNIGRGFIGKILADSDYETTFVDVNEPLIKALNEKKTYRVIYAEEEKRSFSVSNIRGLHSNKDEDKVIDAICKADLLTTAVGAHILPHIAPLVAKGLTERVSKSNSPLNIIACENAIGGTDQLKKAIFEHVDKNIVEDINRLIGFPNAAVDRIVPNQNQENMLDVLVEPFFEWVVDKTALKGDIPPINDIHFVNQLDAYIERKLFTVNTGHALAAYIGYQAGKTTVQEALQDPSIQQQVRQGLEETGKLVCGKHGFDESDHALYIEKILGRFTNPFIIDDVTRVARQPIKKLGSNERLISPVKQLIDRNIDPIGLLNGIVSTLHYDYADDKEAVELQKRILQYGVTATLSEISGLDEKSIITKKITELYSQSK